MKTTLLALGLSVLLFSCQKSQTNNESVQSSLDQNGDEARFALALIQQRAIHSPQSMTPEFLPVEGAPQLNVLVRGGGGVAGVPVAADTVAVGEVDVDDDADNVTTNIFADEGWELLASSLFISHANATIPSGSVDGAAPWEYPYARLHNNRENSTSYSVPKSSIGSSSCKLSVYTVMVKKNASGNITSMKSGWAGTTPISNTCSAKRVSYSCRN